MIPITPAISIDESEVQMHFIRASGPGGQNVNKVSTAVELRFDVAASPALPADVKSRLRTLAGRRMTDQGMLILDARSQRSQSRNRQEALDRLVELIRQAAAVPKRRRKTRPTLGSRKRRMETKRRRSETKRSRRFEGE